MNLLCVRFGRLKPMWLRLKKIVVTNIHSHKTTICILSVEDTGCNCCLTVWSSSLKSFNVPHCHATYAACYWEAVFIHTTTVSQNILPFKHLDKQPILSFIWTEQSLKSLSVKLCCIKIHSPWIWNDSTTCFWNTLIKDMSVSMIFVYSQSWFFFLTLTVYLNFS